MAHAEQLRRGYQTPRVTALGDWTALTLANSVPNQLGIPPFLR